MTLVSVTRTHWSPCMSRCGWLLSGSAGWLHSLEQPEEKGWDISSKGLRTLGAGTTMSIRGSVTF